MAQSLTELRSAKEQLEEENKEMKKQLALANTSNSIISQLVQDNDSPFSTQALVVNLTQEIAKTSKYTLFFLAVSLSIHLSIINYYIYLSL
jgi:cell division inhibitor SulA